MIDFKQLAQQYKSELLDKVVPFWLDYSIDRECGGYYTCLERDGSVFDTDKFVWLQGREVWMLATLYNKVEQRQEWLEAAIHGAEFLKQHGHDSNLNWYFAFDREGHPLVEPYNIFSYTFAVIAFGQLYLATGNEEYKDISRHTFDIVLSKVDNPKGRWNKAAQGARALKSFALPMILCNVALEIEPLLEPAFMEKTIRTCIHEVMDVFYRPEVGPKGLIVEHLGTNNELVDCMDGRLLNPGHAIEAMWFIMDLGKRLGDQQLIERACQIALQEAEYGWDEQYGGIFYFMDRKGHPLQQLEWDQKLWWVHLETLITMLKGYQLTGNEECLRWFERVHDYTWSHFTDPEHPEWFGYLNRQGERLLTLKGGKWKGCFHVPRGLMNVWRMLDEIANREA
ncbi:MAG: AGE family epimerase/isomerase [Bacteroidaceae bacterium]|nr:AGE family epimerase/isomerase [Bacteroidaceae bacterium]